jgi:hypothetical protein
MSSDHFAVDGTLLNAWASHKSFKPKDGPPSDPPVGRDAEVGWHGQKRSNETHASTTDPEARLYRKCSNTAATLCFSGHLLMENRTAHVAQHTNQRRSASDGRTTRHPGHAVSMRIRKRIEEPFGWIKTIGGGRKLRYLGRERHRAWFKITAAVYNLIRITALDAKPA